MLAVIALGSTIIGATTIAGLLTLYELRAAKDAAQSAGAIAAADTGLEYGLYMFFHPTSTLTLTLPAGESVVVTCYDAGNVPIPSSSCAYTNTSTVRIDARGTYGTANRMFELRLQ